MSVDSMIGSSGWPWDFFELTGAIMLGLAPDGRVIYINQKGAETLGYPLHEILGQDWFENFLPPRIREQVRQVFRQVGAGAANAPDSFENPVQCRDGSERLIAWRNAVLRDKSGRVAIGLSSGEDVTERRRAEAALRASEARFRATFEQAAVGMAHLALDGRFLRLNDRLCAITGFDRAELEGRSFADLADPRDRPAEREQAAALHGGTIDHYAAERRYVRKDGRVIWGNLTASLVRDGSEEDGYVVAVLEDITRRKEAEALVGDRALLHMALSAAGAGAWRWDGRTGRQTWSPEVYRLFGLSRAAGPPPFRRWLRQCVHPGDRRAVIEAARRALAEADGEFSAGFRARCGGSGVRRVNGIGRVVRGPAGALQVYGLALDVTGRDDG